MVLAESIKLLSYRSHRAKKTEGSFMEQNFHHRECLLVQLREAYGRVVYTYTTHLKMMNHLVKKNSIIRYIQIILSAISTGGFLGAIITNEFTLTYVGGLFSTALLAFNLFFKDFNLLDEIKQHHSAANHLWIVREDYISLLTDFSILSDLEIMAQRDKLKSRVFEIYKIVPKTDKKSYKEAQNALKLEEEQFFTPEEIDKMLPSHLRNNGRGSLTKVD